VAEGADSLETFVYHLDLLREGLRAAHFVRVPACQHRLDLFQPGKMLYFLRNDLLKCRVLLKFGFCFAGDGVGRAELTFSEIINLLVLWNWRLISVLQKTCTLQLEDVGLRELGLDFWLRNLDTLYHVEDYPLSNESFLLLLEHLVVGIGPTGARVVGVGHQLLQHVEKEETQPLHVELVTVGRDHHAQIVLLVRRG